MGVLLLPRKLKRLSMAAAYTGFCATAALASTTLRRSDGFTRIRRGSYWNMVWCRGMCRVLGVQLSVAGQRTDTPGMTVSNHVSYLDILALGSLEPTVFVAKSEIGRWPIIGRLAKLAGTVFVERGSKTASARTLEVVQGLLLKGVHVAVFPEGTSTDGSSVAPFRRMFFEAPLRTGQPVKPLSVTHSVPEADKGEIEVAWHGDMSLLPHLWRLLGAGRIHTSVNFCGLVRPEPSEAKQPRKAFARASWKRVLEGLSRMERKCA